MPRALLPTDMGIQTEVKYFSSRPSTTILPAADRITSYNVCYTKLLRAEGVVGRVGLEVLVAELEQAADILEDQVERRNQQQGDAGRITSYNVCYTKLLRVQGLSIVLKISRLGAKTH